MYFNKVKNKNIIPHPMLHITVSILAPSKIEIYPDLNYKVVKVLCYNAQIKCFQEIDTNRWIKVNYSICQIWSTFVTKS
jgi:hypothetical protein